MLWITDTLHIADWELSESFVRASGPGGQNVNKVSTAVRLSHKASGLDIKCSTHRTQGLNRYAARVMLCEKLEQRERDARAEENPTHKKKRLAKLDRKRKAKRKAAAKRTNKRPNTNWKDSGEW